MQGIPGYEEFMERVCWSKHGYRTRRNAVLAGRYRMAAGEVGLTSYLCPYCQLWHLTKKPRSWGNEAHPVSHPQGALDEPSA